MADFIDDGRHDAGQWQRAAAGHQRGRAWQGRHHVTARFGLPEGVHDRAFLVADVFVVPHPGFGVDGLAHRAKNAQAAQVGSVGVHLRVGLGGLDERTDGRRGGVEHADLVALDHFPETAGVRVSRHALKNDLGGACSQGAVGDIGVAGDPADVGRAPEDVAGADVKSPVHRQLGPQQIAAGAVLHTLGFAGRAGGVQNEQRMFGADKLGLAHGGLGSHAFVHQAVTAGNHVAGRLRALVNDDVLDRLATAHGDAFIDDGLEGQFLAAAQLVVGRDHRHSAGVLNALLQALGRKAAEHHRVRGANAGAGLHGHHAFDCHGHVDDDAVALFHAHAFEHVGKLADLGVQFFVSDVGHLAVITFKDDGFLLLGGCAQMAVQAVVRGVDQAVGEPLVKRCVRLVQGLGEGLFPAEVLAGQAGPVAFKVGFSFLAQRFISCHAGDASRLGKGRVGVKNPVFDQCGLDCR